MITQSIRSIDSRSLTITHVCHCDICRPECGIIRQSAAIGDDDSSSATDDITDNNTIQLKFQCSTRRGVLLINVNKYDKLATALQEYSRKKKIPLQNLRFMFDGEKLDPSETAITLDLEGGECIDVYPV